MESDVFPKPWVTNKPQGVSLFEMLSPDSPHKCSLLPKEKCLLMYLLARSFWEFYGSDWMTTPWTAENIHFVYERRDDTDGIYLHEPFIRYQFDGRKWKDSASHAQGVLCHIKALGVILLELELGYTIRSCLPGQYKPNGAPVDGSEVFWATNLIQKADIKELMADDLYLAINSCLNATPFKDFHSDVSRVRKTLDSHVVGHLKGLAQLYGKPPEAISFRKPKLIRQTSVSAYPQEASPALTEQHQ